MQRAIGCLLITYACLLPSNSWAEEDAASVIRSRLSDYLDAFNKNDSQAVAKFWAEEGVSLNEETGERTVGRAALQADFEQFFVKSAGARLTGHATDVRLIRPDVAIVEGEVTVFVPGTSPTTSVFTAVMVKEGGAWMLESSQERDLPSPTSPAVALKELAWLVGEWKDQTAGVAVATTVRWSANQAFLIRSYHADYEDGDSFEGTQVIGWDPKAKKFRTWSFNSDGSFGEGVASKNRDTWLIKMSHVQSNGAVSTATQVLTQIDENTMTVQRIGQTVDGNPTPASEPVTVVRVPTSREG